MLPCLDQERGTEESFASRELYCWPRLVHAFAITPFFPDLVLSYASPSLSLPCSRVRWLIPR